jgi:hypothetical protein
MAYNPNIPQGGDRPKDSQPQILANFTGIKTLVDVDHATFDLANQGMHNKVTLPVQAVAPALAANNGFYNFLHPATAKNQTYIHNQTFAGTSDIPMSASILSSAAPVLGMNGWTYLPSGVIMRWDTSAVVAGAQTITLPALPGLVALTTIFSVNITPATAGLSVQLTGITNNTQFTVSSSGAGSIRILTIGN